MASLLEYFLSEVIEIAGDICLADGKHLIKNRHLVQAIGKDKEIQKVLKNFIIHKGGRAHAPIHEKLLPHKKGKKGQSDEVDDSGNALKVNPSQEI